MSEGHTILSVMSPLSLPETRRVAGIVTTAELLAAGNTEDEIKTLLRRGDLIRLRRGAYARGPEGREYLALVNGERLLGLAAALAIAGPAAAASHSSAAYLHGIDLLGKPGPAFVTSPPERGGRGLPGIQVSRARLPAAHVTTAGRLRVTTPARTVVDLARTLELRDGVVCADSALQRRLTTKAELQSVLATCARWRGARQAAEVIEFADGRAESPLESLARLAFRDSGLPPPALQVWLGGTVEPIGRVDFYWRKYWTIAEVDGALKYADPDRARAQLRRDSLLRDDGFEVVHFTWEQITTAPEAVAASIRRAFRRGVRNATRPGRPA
jgi:hypothetical protein